MTSRDHRDRWDILEPTLIPLCSYSRSQYKAIKINLRQSLDRFVLSKIINSHISIEFHLHFPKFFTIHKYLKFSQSNFHSPNETFPNLRLCIRHFNLKNWIRKKLVFSSWSRTGRCLMKYWFFETVSHLMIRALNSADQICRSS